MFFFGLEGLFYFLYVWDHVGIASVRIWEL